MTTSKLYSFQGEWKFKEQYLHKERILFESHAMTEDVLNLILSNPMANLDKVNWNIYDLESVWGKDVTLTDDIKKDMATALDDWALEGKAWHVEEFADTDDAERFSIDIFLWCDEDGTLKDYLVPALAITATLREKEEGGLVVVVQGHHRNHTAKQYDFNHGAACPFADAVTKYIDELQLMSKATGDIFRIHNDWEPDSKTFIFTG